MWGYPCPDFLPLLVTSPHSDRLFVMPESSARCLQWDGNAWVEQYEFSLTDEERAQIRKGIEESVIENGVLEGGPRFGEQFLEKKSQTAFAALGLDVPVELKYSWDPGDNKRKILRAAILRRLPEFEVLLGGATSLDVTKLGVDKSYGVQWLSKKLGIPPKDMYFVGDGLHEWGNDAVVIPTGIQTRPVTGPSETSIVLDELLAACISSTTT